MIRITRVALTTHATRRRKVRPLRFSSGGISSLAGGASSPRIKGSPHRRHAASLPRLTRPQFAHFRLSGLKAGEESSLIEVKPSREVLRSAKQRHYIETHSPRLRN